MSAAPAPDGFSASLRRMADDLWREIHDHPFVQGLGDGSLSQERYAFYLGQDYAYLVDYARAMALGAAHADDLEGLCFFAEQAHLTLTQEMALHRRVAAAYDLTEADLLAVERHPVSVAYGEHLIGTARRGREADLIAALLPCALGYVEIASRLAARGLPDVPAYRAWIDTYTSEGMVAMADWLVRRLDRAAEAADEATNTCFLDLYRTSVRMELAFFTTAWEVGGAS